MGLLHIPRVVASCARGYYKRRGSPPSPNAGVGRENSYKYQAHVGVFDVDGLGHMNNASYLVHAELARWELGAYTGVLDAHRRDKSAFVVTGAAVRYRREIGPLWKRFDIDTYVGSLDKRNLWFYQTFRYPENGDKILAQLLLQAVLVKGRTVVDPRIFLEEECGVDSELLDELCHSNHDEFMKEKKSRFEQLEQALRKSAAADDRISSKNELGR